MPVDTLPARHPKPKANPASVVRLLLVLLLAAAAFVQFTTVSQTVVRYPLRADAGDYFAYAYNLRHFGTFSMARVWEQPPPRLTPAPDKLRPPGYPVFLQLAGQPAPHLGWGLRAEFLQAALGVLTVLLSFLIGRRLAGPAWGLAAGALVVLEPQLATISTYLLTESLFTFLLAFATWASLRALDGRRAAWFVAAGLAWGVASLVRPTPQFLLPVLFILAWTVPRLREWRRGATLAVLAFALVVAPWMVRNQSSTLAHTPSVMVNSLVHGSYPDFLYHDDPRSLGIAYRFDPDIDARTRDLSSALRSIASEARRAPATYARWYLVGKPLTFLSLRDIVSRDVFLDEVDRSPFLTSPLFRALRNVGWSLHWPAVILALATMLVLVVRPRALRLNGASLIGVGFIAVLVAYAIGLHMIVAPYPRYGIPFRPLLFLLALVAVRAVLVRVRNARSRPREAAAI